MLFSEKVKSFNRSLQFKVKLPKNIGVLNPFQEEAVALQCADIFYDKYYHDTNKRWGIFGINPGRFGGGLTGVPFTDFKRLREVCGIDTKGHSSNEPSSYFVYSVVAAMGGATTLYTK